MAAAHLHTNVAISLLELNLITISIELSTNICQIATHPPCFGACDEHFGLLLISEVHHICL